MHEFGEFDLNKASKQQHLECLTPQNREIGAPPFSTAVRHLTASLLASRTMRTTIDIDDPILQELKPLQQQQGKSLGRLVSDLLAQALVQTGKRYARKPAFHWVCVPMNARVDLADKHALLDAMDTAAPSASVSTSTSCFRTSDDEDRTAHVVFIARAISRFDAQVRSIGKCFRMGKHFQRQGTGSL